MSEDRRQILQMLAEGKITADEAERLLAAMEAPPLSDSLVGAYRAAGSKPKYLRVQVDAPDHHPDKEPVKVNIRVPMNLLRAGVRFGALIPQVAKERVNAALHEQGIPFDVDQLRPQDLEALVEQLSDLTVDVDQGETKVRVFCE
jgi:hypothetical protein